MTELMLTITAFLLSFLVGALPFSYWVVQIAKGEDIRKSGSGNAGATNVFRTQGKKLGSIALGLDILKGLAAVTVIPMIIASPSFINPFLYSLLIGVAAILGHTWTPFLGWKGGKGVAATAGVFLGLLPIPFFIALTCFLVVFYISKIISISSLTAAALFPVIVLILERGREHYAYAFIVSCFLAAFIFFTHRSNIMRLMHGKENKMGKNK